MTERRKSARNPAAAPDAESQALAASPAFQALLAAGRAGPAVPLEELEQRLGPLTAAEQARADLHLGVFPIRDVDIDILPLRLRGVAGQQLPFGQFLLGQLALGLVFDAFEKVPFDADAIAMQFPQTCRRQRCIRTRDALRAAGEDADVRLNEALIPTILLDPAPAEWPDPAVYLEEDH